MCHKGPPETALVAFWGLRKGAVGYLVKPYELSKLLSTVDEARQRVTQVAAQLADARE